MSMKNLIQVKKLVHIMACVQKRLWSMCTAPFHIEMIPKTSRCLKLKTNVKKINVVTCITCLC